jgi:hypothetical protein
MTKVEHARMSMITKQTDMLMNSGASVNPRVTNADVIEAMLGDIALVQRGNAPRHLAALIVIEVEGN